MKKIILVIFLFGNMLTLFGQAEDIEQLKLDLEKLAQMKIMLQSMYDGYNTLNKGYSQISSLAKCNYDLHKNYLDVLLQVSPSVKNYPVIQTILDKQSTLVYEAAAAYSVYVKSGLFITKELLSIKNRFDQFKSILTKKLDQLNLVLTPGALRMSDQDRLSTIDRIDKDVGEVLAAGRAVVKEQNAVAAGRGQQKKEIDAMRLLYGLKQ